MIALWWAAPALALSLGEVRELAAERAIEVERARADAAIARATTTDVVGVALPSVVGFVDYSIGAGQTAFGFERPVRDQAGIGVQASWRAIDPATWAAADAARRSARGQEALYEWTRLVSRSEATAAYAAVLAEQEVVSAYARALEDAERQERAASSLVEAGLRPPADRARAIAEKEGARAALVSSQGEAVALCAQLQGLLRVQVTGECDLEPVSWREPPEATEEHPALVAAREAWRASRAGRTAAALEFAPTVSASGTAAQYIVEGSAGFGWSAAIGVDVPLVLGGTRFAHLAEARARKIVAEAALDAQERDLEALAIIGEARLTSAEARVASLEAALEAADEALRLVEERYNAGLDSMTDWLTARRSRDLAAVALAQGRGDLGRAVAELEAARGLSP